MTSVLGCRVPTHSTLPRAMTRRFPSGDSWLRQNSFSKIVITLRCFRPSPPIAGDTHSPRMSPREHLASDTGCEDSADAVPCGDFLGAELSDGRSRNMSRKVTRCVVQNTAKQSTAIFIVCCQSSSVLEIRESATITAGKTMEIGMACHLQRREAPIITPTITEQEMVPRRLNNRVSNPTNTTKPTQRVTWLNMSLPEWEFMRRLVYPTTIGPATGSCFDLSQHNCSESAHSPCWKSLKLIATSPAARIPAKRQNVTLPRENEGFAVC